MLTYNDKIYVGYRKKELESEVHNIMLVSEAAVNDCSKPSILNVLLAGIGKKLVTLGCWLEKRYGAVPNKCHPGQRKMKTIGIV